jgi:hypothetical protein
MAALDFAALSVTGIAVTVYDVCAVLSVLSILSTLLVLSTLSGTVVVSLAEVIEAEAVVVRDSCLILVVLAVTLAEEAEAAVVVNLMPQTFSASKLKSRFLALHSVCWRWMDSKYFGLVASHIFRASFYSPGITSESHFSAMQQK